MKDTLLLLVIFGVLYYLFNLVRLNPKTGPTIIKGRYLKTSLYFSLAVIWSAVIVRLLSDSVKIVFPFDRLVFFKVAEFLDETIGHVFIYATGMFLLIINLFLEIERPFRGKLTKKQATTSFSLASLTGIMWGLNLTEGRLSLQTSVPLMVIYLILAAFFFTKYKLNLLTRPFILFSTVFVFFSLTAFLAWGLTFRAFPEFFSYLK